jgi:hypothetical protein
MDSLFFSNPLVPIFIIDQLVDKVIDGTIKDYYYNPESAVIER